MANRILRVIFKKIHVDGSIDTIFFKSRAKDVMANDDGSKTLADIVNKVDNVKEGATKTEASSTNGQLLIDGKETTVYKHPNSGVTAGTYNKVTVNAEGHVTGASNETDWTGTVSGDGSNETSTFTEATTRENLKTGEKHSTMFGKISKWFADLKPLAFVEKVGTSNLDTTLTTFYNNRVTTDKVTTSTSITEAGWVADARAIASLKNSIDSINSNLNGNSRVKYYGRATTLAEITNLIWNQDRGYMGFIDWRDITNIIPGASGITIWFTSDYTIWAFDGNQQQFIYDTNNPQWRAMSNGVHQYDMSNYSYKDLEKLAKTAYPIIGSARWNGTLVPNAQNGFVFLSNDTATLLSITGEIYRYNPHVNDTAWTKVR